MVPNFVQRVGLARTGGKQAILKRADHRFIERIEFVSHNGCASFPQALREYHECAEGCKSFGGNIGKFLQLRMPRPAHVALAIWKAAHRRAGEAGIHFWGIVPEGSETYCVHTSDGRCLRELSC